MRFYSIRLVMDDDAPVYVGTRNGHPGHWVQAYVFVEDQTDDEE